MCSEKRIITTALALTFIILASPVMAQKRQPIIDVHVHSGEGPEKFLPEGPPYQLCRDPFVLADPSTRIQKDGVRRLSDIYQCEGEVMLSPMTNAEWKKSLFAEFEKYNYVAALNSDRIVERMEEWQTHTDIKLIPSLIVWKDTQSPEEVRKLIEDGRIKGIGEVAVQYYGMAANDPYMDPYYALAEEYDLPVAVHITGGAPGNDYIGYHDVNTYRSDFTHPLDMEDVLRRFPNLRVYVMHAGWPMLDEMLLLMYMHPQVYVDIAMIMTVLPRKEVHRYLKAMVDAGMGKRIMWGTDHAVWPQVVSESVAVIESADFLTEEQKSDIFFNNAVTFFRLDADELLKGRD